MRYFLQALEAFQHSERWFIAYSGGLDSSVLLHHLASLPVHPPLHAVHVNHQLSIHADSWQRHAQQCCDGLQVPLTVINVDVSGSEGKGLEDAARKARYRAFESVLEAGDVLMLAHHQDDQIETMLLHLLRGAGVRGLAGMPQQRAIGAARLLRPLLKHNRAELVSYAQAHQLQYVIDDSNDNIDFDRNYLRHKVMPLLADRWPEFAGNWAHSAEVLASTADTLDTLAQADGVGCELQAESYGCSLQLEAIRALPPLRVYGVLRYACEQFSIAALRRTAFNAIMHDLIDARPDAQPKVSWSGGEARRYDGRLYLLRDLPQTNVSTDVVWARVGSDQDVFEPAIDGIGLLRVCWSRPPAVELPVRVSFRQGGEIIRQQGRNSKALKQWFQEQRVPPWLRERTPLLFVQQQLAAVGEHCVSSSADWEVKNIHFQRSPC